MMLAGCSKSPPPPPDGSSGISGICLLPSEPAGEDGKLPPRKRWARLRIEAMLVNSPNAEHAPKTRTISDGTGAFRLVLNPGDYVVGMSDDDLLKNKALSPMIVKVEAGQFTEIVIDYDKLNVRDVR